MSLPPPASLVVVFMHVVGRPKLGCSSRFSVLLTPPWIAPLELDSSNDKLEGWGTTSGTPKVCGLHFNSYSFLPKTLHKPHGNNRNRMRL